MKLIIGSVFCETVRNWYDLQISFIHKTTKNFEHVVCSNLPIEYKHSKVIPKTPDMGGGAEHLDGLCHLMDYFKTTDGDYFLILDSDCFPIKLGWQNILSKYMAENKRDVASVVRYENLDNFAHPCVTFFNRSALERIAFARMQHFNKFGFPCRDISVENIGNFVPLIRSNKVNEHPVMYAIYWNAFYHHGAGSRNKYFRVNYYRYYNENFKRVQELEELRYNELVKNPDNYISKYLGHNLYL